MSSGDVSGGDVSSGDMSIGDMSSGGMSSGDLSSGDVSSGDMSSGDMSSRGMSSGDMSSRGMSSGDLNCGDLSSGDLNSGDMSSRGMSSGDMSSGDMSSGDMSSGDMSSLLTLPSRSPQLSPSPPKMIKFTLVMMLLVVSRTLSSSGRLSSTTVAMTDELHLMNASSTQPAARQKESPDSSIALVLHVKTIGRDFNYSFTLEILKSLHACMCSDGCKSFAAKVEEKEMKVRASYSEDGVSLMLEGNPDSQMTVMSEHVLDLFYCSNDTCVSMNNQSTTTSAKPPPAPAPTPTSTARPHSTDDTNTTKKIILAVCIPVGGIMIVVAVSLIVLKYKRRRVYRLDNVYALYRRDNSAPEENVVELNVTDEISSV
ncbi:hypothetical protein Btru_030529 [Bulinus truncatus]|nr:hypothetical protein Btru_030529 [Bulinus truncatus]